MEDYASELQLLNQWDSDSKEWRKRPPSKTLEATYKFDLVSMQFALHYMFQTEERANRFFQTLSQHIHVGGYFVATTVNAGKMIQHLMKAGPGENSFSIKDSKNRESCQVEFDQEARNALLSKGKHKERENWLGLRYHFLLKDGNDNDDSAAVSAPEWLVPVNELERVARKHDFRLVLYESLPNFVHEQLNTHDYEKMEAYRDLMYRMNVLNYKGTLSDVEWDITSLYVVVALQKVEPVSKPSVMSLVQELRKQIPAYDDIPAEERSRMLTQRMSS